MLVTSTLTSWTYQVPDKCASSPCINDGTCQDSCVEGSGFKCLCIDGRNGDKCQYWTGKEKVLLSIRQPEKMHSVQLARVVLLKK